MPHPKLDPIDPALVEEAATASFDAGAAGLLLSREYEFMRVETLDAVGRAVDRRQGCAH